MTKGKSVTALRLDGSWMDYSSSHAANATQCPNNKHKKALIQTGAWLVSFVFTGNIFVLKTEKYDLKNFTDDQQRKQSIKC